MEINKIKDIYNDVLINFSETLKKTSEDTNNQTIEKCMTMCETTVLNFDNFKDEFVKNMKLNSVPKSCDALYMTDQNEIFLIEFKNGKIEALKNYEVKIKIYESLLILCEKFSITIDFTRNNISFILVYNEDAAHGLNQYEDTGLNKLQIFLFNLANEPIIRFGLNHFKKLYFKEVYTYTKAEFESKFVSKYCT
jgi:hypothetical protein